MAFGIPVVDALERAFTFTWRQMITPSLALT